MVIKRKHHCRSTPFSETIFPLSQLTFEITASYQTTSQGAPSEDDPTNTTVSTFRNWFVFLLLPMIKKYLYLWMLLLFCPADLCWEFGLQCQWRASEAGVWTIRSVAPCKDSRRQKVWFCPICWQVNRNFYHLSPLLVSSQGFKGSIQSSHVFCILTEAVLKKHSGCWTEPCWEDKVFVCHGAVALLTNR